jgi:flagellar biosynthesis protein FlhG
MLREMRSRRRYVKTIAVASGKGGVGKTNVTANLAIALRKLGKNVMIVDADLGMSNIDILLQVYPKHTILQLLNDGMSLKDIVVQGPHGVEIVAAGTGVQELSALTSLQRLKILEAFEAYDSCIDVLLIDTAAGLSENAAFFCCAAEEIIIVTSPEPTSIADAYALIKTLYTRHQQKDFHILVNSGKDAQDAVDVFRRISCHAEELHGISLDYLGYLPFDEAVSAAVRAQQPFIDLYPRSLVSKGIVSIAKKFLQPGGRVKGNLQFFIGSLLETASDRSR